MKRSILAFLIALSLLISGCASLPTSGSVEKVGEQGGLPGDTSIDVAPAPPVPGGSPEVILAGFLAATSAATADGYDVARLYLTPAAGTNWDPNAGLTIFDSEGHPPVVTQNSAVLSAPVVGRLSPDGHYAAGLERDFTHNFAMIEINGEWRIDNPGVGVLISRYAFERTYRATPVHFLDRTGTRTVIENVYLPARSLSPRAAVQALLRGPSPWLRPAVLTVIPAEARSTAASVAVSGDGVAEVSLGSLITTLSDDQRVQLAAQVLWTLASFPTVRGMRIVVNGETFPIRGQDADGVLRFASFQNYRPPTGTTPISLAVIDGVVMELPTQPATSPKPLEGPFGSTAWGGQIGDLAASPDGAEIAVVSADRTQLISGSARVPGQVRVRLTEQGMTRPQIDRNGMTWVFINEGGQPVLLRLAADGKLTRTPVPELAGSTVTAFNVSPDLTRLAVVTQTGDTTRAGLLRVRGGEQQVVDGWIPAPLTTARGEMVGIRDVGWVNDSRLLILAATRDDAHYSVYTSDLDGAVVESVGPSSDVDAASLVVAPRAEGVSAMIRTSSGRALRYEDRSRWIQVADQSTALAWLS